MRFLLVDRILELESGTRIVGTKHVAMAEDYLTWHFPERPILPGNLIVAAGTQLAGWLEAEASGFARTVLLAGLEHARFVRFAVPGDRVTLEVRMQGEGDRRTFSVHASVDDDRVAELECIGAVTALEALEDPEDMRRRLAQLRGQETKR